MMRARIFLCVALAAILLQVSSEQTYQDLIREDGETERIIDGKSAVEGQFPWATALLYNDQFICTSSIISPRTILTAAHCVVFNGVTEPASSFQVLANFRRSADDIKVGIQSVIPHPEYTDSNGIHNDIAILITTDDIPLSGPVDKVCIAGKDTAMYQYKNATAMGWGFTDRPRTNLPDELQYVDQKVVLNTLCSVAYFGLPIEQNKICAGFLNGICNGDSGGPLVHFSADGKQKPVEIGIASFISGFFGCGFLAPGVYTRVSSYYDFIMASAFDPQNICTIPE